MHLAQENIYNNVKDNQTPHLIRCATQPWVGDGVQWERS